MSTAIAKIPTAVNLPSMSMDEGQLIEVLRNSLYPGAADNSIKLVISYCKASGLDPMQKPVHIVPIYDSKAGSMRDVVMPGIGLYRTQAARSGEYAGVTEPEFGPDVTENIGGVETTYPSWCKVTVKRLLPTGQIVEFSATERWKENYAMKGGKEKSIAPNAMWSKRPYGQLAKCAEAQALRKAFPEFGAQPTADEMEGKEIDMGTVDRTTGEITQSQRLELPAYTDEIMETDLKKVIPAIKAGKITVAQAVATIKSKFTVTPEQETEFINRATLENAPIDGDFVAEMVQAEGAQA